MQKLILFSGFIISIGLIMEIIDGLIRIGIIR